MSVNALANGAAARRPDFFRLDTVSSGIAGIAIAAATSPTTNPLAASEAVPIPSPSQQIETAYHVLFGYIPTEILTLYVGIFAGLNKTNEVIPGEWITFWAFLLATPLVVWLVYGAKVKAVGETLTNDVRIVAALGDARRYFSLHSVGLRFAEYTVHSVSLVFGRLIWGGCINSVFSPWFVGAVFPTSFKVI